MSIDKSEESALFEPINLTDTAEDDDEMVMCFEPPVYGIHDAKQEKEKLEQKTQVHFAEVELEPPLAEVPREMPPAEEKKIEKEEENSPK